MPALDHLRVLELPGAATAYCGRLLADLGADVVKIEPPEGDPGRRVAPFAKNVPHLETSLWFLNFHTNKRSTVLDLGTRAGKREFLALVRDADVVLDALTPAESHRLGLSYEALSRGNPGIVVTSISAFGRSGPHSGFLGGDLVASAMSGLMTTQGDPDFPPCNAPLEQGYQLSGLHAAIGTLFALLQRRAVGRGDHVDVSIQEVLGHMTFTLARYDLEADIPDRPGDRGNAAGISVYHTRDGFAHVYARRWQRLAEWMADPELSTEKWQEREYREDHEREANRIIDAFLSRFSGEELLVEGQARGIAVGPMSRTNDFVASPHIQARGFFSPVEHPVLGAVTHPGGPYHLSATPRQVLRPAPMLGQHTAEVLGNPRSAGFQPGENTSGPAGSRPHARSMPLAGNPVALTAGFQPAGARLPFAGIRVMDFTVAFAGPFTTRYLAELGAEVIKVESTMAATNTEAPSFRHGNPGGRTGNFVEINRSKRSITLDLHRPEAQALARRLAAVSDIAINNLRPGAVARWGLGYEDLRRVNPGIIFAEMPGFGATGPYSGFMSLGQSLIAYTGLMRLWGHPDSPENRRCKAAYPDWIGAGHAATAILAALHHRERTGAGQHIEVAQVEAAAAMQGVAFLDYFVNGRSAEPQGNRHTTYAPHNTYPCLGHDRWVAIAVESDGQWERLVSVLGTPDWAPAEDLASASGRKAREQELDDWVTRWTRERTPHQAMRILQRAGVPAGAVQNGEDVYLDPHLRARGYSVPVQQPYLGVLTQAGHTVRFRRNPVPPPRGAPTMGEANAYVFGEVLGLSEAEQRRLVEDRVIV